MEYVPGFQPLGDYVLIKPIEEPVLRQVPIHYVLEKPTLLDLVNVRASCSAANWNAVSENCLCSFSSPEPIEIYIWPVN
jgi:hypothetical protein